MITILCGENNWAVKKAVDVIVNSFLKQYGDLAIERFEGEDTTLDQAISAVNNLPFLVESKLVVLRRASENSELSSNIDKLLANVIDTNHLLVVEGKLDKRSFFYKTLKKHTEFREFSSKAPADLASWCVEVAKTHQASLSRVDANYLIQRVGPDQNLLAHEIDKLATYSNQIDRESIRLLTDSTPESSIFDLLSAAFNGETERALKLYEEQKAQKVEPFAVLSMITWQLHRIALAKTSGENSSLNLARKASMSSYSAEKALGLSRGLTLSKIAQLARDVAELEYRAKTSSYDVDDGLRALIVSI